MVVILVNSKHSVLNMGTAVASSVISPAHMRSVGSSGTTYSSTVAAGMDQSMHSPATAIDLYNIARIGTASSGEASDIKADGNMNLKIQVQHSISEVYDA